MTFTLLNKYWGWKYDPQLKFVAPGGLRPSGFWRPSSPVPGLVRVLRLVLFNEVKPPGSTLSWNQWSTIWIWIWSPLWTWQWTHRLCCFRAFSACRRRGVALGSLCPGTFKPTESEPFGAKGSKGFYWTNCKKHPSCRVFQRREKLVKTDVFSRRKQLLRQFLMLVFHVCAVCIFVPLLESDVEASDGVNHWPTPRLGSHRSFRTPRSDPEPVRPGTWSKPKLVRPRTNVEPPQTQFVDTVSQL